MKKIHKSTPIFFKDMTTKVKPEEGLISDVVIIAKGWDKVGDYIDEVFMKELVAQGNAQTQGVKSRFGHPNMCSESLGSFIGRYKNFRMTDEAVIADLYLDEGAKKSPKGNLHDYCLEMAQKNSDMFGNSIVFMDGEAEEVEGVDQEGKKANVMAIRCKSFLASDLVDSPAATTNLFKEDGDFAAKATDFLDENPELFDLVTKKPEIIKSFFVKYQNYKHSIEMSTKSKSLLERFKENATRMFNELSGKKSIPVTGADNSPANVITDQETPAVNDAVQLPNGSPAPDGEYTTATGEKLTVVGGVVTAIAPKVEAPAPDAIQNSAEDEEAIAKEFADLKLLNANQAKQIADLQKSIDDMNAKFKSLKVNYTPPVREGLNKDKPVDTNKPLTKEEEKEKINKYVKKGKPEPKA